jgi:prepilin-type processing-associated H-X9-DG protein
MPLSVAAGMALPAISMVRESARKANAASNMRQIVVAAIVYGSENDNRWPKDLATLKTWSDGELVDKLFQSPGHPEIAQPFLYVRPDPKAKAMQPVLVQDPACNRGRGSNVVYADGHAGFVKGVALWAEAQRLAALPKAAAEGIEMADWQVDTTTGIGPGGPAPAGDPKAVF